jgi:hypothetical protein
MRRERSGPDCANSFHFGTQQIEGGVWQVTSGKVLVIEF